MSYNPTQWSAGDTVTSAKLNKIEQGISDNGVLEINVTADEEAGKIRLDKTWQEIYNANNSVIIVPPAAGFEQLSPTRAKVIDIGQDVDYYIVSAIINTALVSFLATAPNDYPIYQVNNSTDSPTPNLS